jgi:hypothetical protein
MTAPSGACDRTMTVPHQSPSPCSTAADLGFSGSAVTTSPTHPTRSCLSRRFCCSAHLVAALLAPLAACSSSASTGAPDTKVTPSAAEAAQGVDFVDRVPLGHGCGCGCAVRSFHGWRPGGTGGGRPPAFDAVAYKQRNAVERCVTPQAVARPSDAHRQARHRLASRTPPRSHPHLGPQMTEETEPSAGRVA